jgi:hypothetical protein
MMSPTVDGHVGAFGKHRVEMRRHHEPGAAAAGALAQRDHIAFGIDGSVLEAEFLHPLLIIFGADLFLERRRRDFGDALLFGKGPLVVGLDVFWDGREWPPGRARKPPAPEPRAPARTARRRQMRWPGSIVQVSSRILRS